MVNLLHGPRDIQTGQCSLLVRFPYTDLSGSKVRPAVILNADKYLAEADDVLCAFISSVLPTRFSIPTSLSVQRIPISEELV
jgi:hypothetical protein